MQLTICKNCKHHHVHRRDTASALIWYNQLCLASPRPVKTDLVTGEECPYGVNDLGTEWVGNMKEMFDRYHVCRDINKDGQCVLYEEK
jgi:hypothetical protein